jgi:hypothetical protein
MQISIYWYIVLGLAIAIVIGSIERKNNSSRWGILGLSFIIGLTIFGLFFAQSRKAETSLRVVGYASKLFDSDLVKWNLTLQRNTPRTNLEAGYKAIAQDITAFKEFLLANGIEASAIEIQPVTTSPVYQDYRDLVAYNLNQNIFVLSNDLARMEDIALNSDFLAKRGVLIQRSELQYLYTKLPDLKKQLLAEATQDAVARATEISGSANTKLGKLREARAGVFQITEPYSTDVSDYGIYNTSTKKKSISVTLTGVFNLR